MRRRAYSLIEITAVILVLAIIAGSVTLRMAATVQRARMEDVVGRIEQFDRLARVHVREHDRPLRLVVNISAGTIRRTDPRGRDEPCPPLVLPDVSHSPAACEGPGSRIGKRVDNVQPAWSYAKLRPAARGAGRSAKVAPGGRVERAICGTRQ